MGGYGMGGYGMGALGMPGMTFPNQYGGSGYGPAPGYSNGGFPGPNTNSAYDQSGTTGTAPDSASIGSAASIESPGPQSNSSERAPLGSAPQPQSTLTTGSDAASARVFAEKGEKLFRSGDYKGAVYQWKHAVVDDPQNGVLAMMLAQSLFATGQYDDAAGATQVAMRLLPRDQWGVVITNRKELYGEPRVYLDQLQTLDKAIKGKPSDPAFRFLAGFHYACLGYPRAAVDNLDKGLKVAPQDELARRLRDEMQARLPKSTTPPTPQPPPTSSAADAPSPEASKKSTSAR
jgi:tetratricopeptide (TPR) repeat protein